MERTVITLQSLLVLLATFHVAAGCECGELDLNSVMCNPQLTVVRATALALVRKAEGPSIHNIADETLTEQFPGKSYRMQLQSTIKTGPNQMEMSDSYFETFSTKEGSQGRPDLVPGSDYLVAGDVTEGGKFRTNLCLFQLWDDLSESQVNLLDGTGTADCAEDFP